jgi:Xaa-Pro aminopeptidase
VLVVRDTVRSGVSTPFASFETLTLCPIELRLLDKTILTKDEVHWLNAYHQRVRKELTPLLGSDAAAWLKKATRAV